MSPTATPTLPPTVEAALEAVTDRDRAWFEAHPHRAYRLRRLQLGEVLPGRPVTPGSYVIVVRLGSPLVRLRVPVGRPPVHLRRDTDGTCRELVRLLTGAGYLVYGHPLAVTLARLEADVTAVMRQHGRHEVRP